MDCFCLKRGVDSKGKQGIDESYTKVVLTKYCLIFTANLNKYGKLGVLLLLYRWSISSTVLTIHHLIFHILNSEERHHEDL